MQKYDLEYEGGGRSDDVDVLEELHAVRLAENLREGLQLARLHVPLHEPADAAELRPRADEAKCRNLDEREWKIDAVCNKIQFLSEDVRVRSYQS